ncbi:MAG: peptidoglycan DD-metalloendopeptidase family protein [Endomicrobiales bacterium]
MSETFEENQSGEVELISFPKPGTFAVFRNVWKPALLAACLAGTGYFLALSYVSRPAAPEPPRVQAQFTSEGLMNDLPLRLAYLAGRTQNVSFYRHTIKSRENLWRLAARRHYSVHTLIGCNPQLETYNVDTGQNIIIPSIAGTLHVAQKNDTWQKIADRYKTTPGEVLKYNRDEAALAAGDLVFVPGRKPDMELMNGKMREKYELRALFISPLGGRLSSVFGMRRHPVTGTRSLHGGIDLAVREGTWVGAAADGKVFVAGTGIGHYGTAVFIDHQNGYVTHYGHLSRIRVRAGQRVKARQLIAKSGSTGRSTGPHLHFTIQKNGVSKDPLKFIW